MNFFNHNLQFNFPQQQQQQPQTSYMSHSSQQCCSQSEFTDDSKVRHSGFSENFTIEYLGFNDLPPITDDTNLMQIFEQTRDDFTSPDWIRQFNAVTSLRILNKSFPLRVNAIFEAFGDCILKALFSPKTGVVKNSLYFINEVLVNAKTSNIGRAVLVRLIEILLKKLVSGSQVIRPICYEGLQLIVANALCDETIRAFCAGSLTPNKTSNEKAFGFLTEALAQLRDNIAGVQPETLKTLFQSLAFALEFGSAQNKTNTRSILAYLNSLMGLESYMNYLKLLYQSGALEIQHVERLAQVTQAREGRKSLGEALRQSSHNPKACLPQYMIPIEIYKKA